MRDYEVPEGFVYNYSNRTWRKYRLGSCKAHSNPSFCDTIEFGLKEYLETPEKTQYFAGFNDLLIK
jgi:hypothetical protein